MIAKVNITSRAPKSSPILIEETAPTTLSLGDSAYFGNISMPASQSRNQSVFGTRPLLSLKIANIEYRVQWDDTAQTWDVLRNGVATSVIGRRKRASAVASAIRDAKAEFKASTGTVVVTCLEGRKLETLWRGTQ